MPRFSDWLQIARGFLMGGADIVPGVSGGTVALILGIYDRLVRAVSHVDATLLDHLRRRNWKAAAAHLDLRFLLTLGSGIALGILSLASLMHFLLEDQEFISVHSIDRENGAVLLNVGTRRGGVKTGTVLTVFRRTADETDRYEPVGRLRLEKYAAETDPAASVRLAMARPISEDGSEGSKQTVYREERRRENIDVRMDDVIVQPSRRRPFTLAAFFGLILASTMLVARMIEHRTVTAGLLAVAGAVFAYWLVGLFPVAPAEGNAYLFFCGALAICAMILPGISGAFILLLLGVYSDVTGLLRNILAGQATPATLLSVVVFSAGCLTGLLSFSKLLNYLLGRHRDLTMAALCGFMAGSLRKIWPFQQDLSPQHLQFKFKFFANVWPEWSAPHTWMILGTVLAAAALVFLLDRLTDGHEHAPHLGAAEDSETKDDNPENADSKNGNPKNGDVPATESG